MIVGEQFRHDGDFLADQREMEPKEKHREAIAESTPSPNQKQNVAAGRDCNAGYHVVNNQDRIHFGQRLFVDIGLLNVLF